jgi:UDP-N-acetylmuramoylalanine--D-glutamate ligase
VPVAVAGNVGTALTTLVGTLDPAAVIVCEASSFQLEDTVAFAPDAAVLLNLAPDHLDRHGTFAAYREAKLRIFANQAPDALAVVPAGLAVPGAASAVTFASPMASGGGEAADGGAAATGGTEAAGGSPAATGAEAADLVVADDALVWRGEPLIGLGDIRLRGTHNVENAMAAAAVTLARGVERAAVCEALRTFAGVPHRLEEIAEVTGVLYVNDSKATNVASAVVGLGSFDRGVHAILGGRGKGADFSPLAAPVAARCRAVYLIGEAAPQIAEALAGTGVPMHHCGDLEHAVAAARGAAVPGEAVVLSPACASFDQYERFEARGDHFRALVEALGVESGRA